MAAKTSRIELLNRSDLPSYQTIGQHTPSPSGRGQGEGELFDREYLAINAEGRGLPRHSAATAGEGKSFEPSRNPVHGKHVKILFASFISQPVHILYV
jgi:hypothetical protein